jgi:ribosomal protein S18 acetylase RimI-like enzyme
VANAAFMVSVSARGKGVGQMLGTHCLTLAKKQGFSSMQFNFVVSSNTSAIQLWTRLGFDIVGTLPKAYHHKTLGKVDVYIMYKTF